jgi:hypothetical protein
MSSNFDWEWTGNQKRWTEDERKKMQEAFDHFHQSKEWDMICTILEVNGYWDIIIRDEAEDYPGIRCLCSACWNKAYLTSEQLAWIQEKMGDLKRMKPEEPEAARTGKHTYKWGCIDSRMCLDGEISASSPEAAECALRQERGCKGTITVFY